MVAKLGMRLGKSTLLWLVLLLLVAELGGKTLMPLASVAHDRQRPEQLTQEALTYKAEGLKALKTSPDVLVLGSSLPMAAFRYCDNQWQKQTDADDDAVKHHLSVFQAYSRGAYLESLLSLQAQQPVSVFNFTSAACMPSDASLILSKAIEFKKKPKLVIIAFGPRDFMDNLVPEIGRTPAFNALADWTCLSGNVPSSLSLDTIRELVLESSSNCYRNRGDWSLLLSELTTHFVRPVASVSSSLPASNPLTATGKEENKHVCIAQQRYEAWHIEDYRKRYNPPNYLRYEQEMERLAYLLDNCRQKQIAAVVVNMPITTTNRELIPGRLLQRYEKDLSSHARQHDAFYVDLSQNPTFTADDFLDTVHVNPQGGKKVLDELARQLGQSNLVAKVLDANSVNSIGLTEKKEKSL